MHCNFNAPWIIGGNCGQRKGFVLLFFWVCRKRQRSAGDEEKEYVVPQPKRPSRGHPLSPEPGRDAWDSEV